MMMVGGVSDAARAAREYDRRRTVGCNCASDVWSLGCLLFEVVTGEYLFSQQDWVALFVTVTSPCACWATHRAAVSVAALSPHDVVAFARGGFRGQLWSCFRLLAWRCLDHTDPSWSRFSGRSWCESLTGDLCSAACPTLFTQPSPKLAHEEDASLWVLLLSHRA